ncbi:MAG: hypothetical protein IJ857_00530 [Lachnospiraceae bacterium]|nr:hypothetical protein [Lachnospiraceae bacterium]
MKIFNITEAYKNIMRLICVSAVFIISISYNVSAEPYIRQNDGSETKIYGQANLDGWERAYDLFLENEAYLTSKNGDFYSVEGQEGSEFNPIAYALFDLNNDGTPELLINNGCESYATDVTYYYGFKNGEVSFLGELEGTYYDKRYNFQSDYPGIFILGGHSGWWTVEYVYIDGQNKEIRERVAYGDDSGDGYFDSDSELYRTDNKDLYEAYLEAKDKLLFTSINDFREAGWEQFRRKYTALSSDTRWDILLRESPGNYDHALSLAAVELSEEAEDDSDARIKEVYQKFGLKEVSTIDYGADYAYAIGYAPITGGNVIVITARGSKTLKEFIEDRYTSLKEDTIFSPYSRYVYANAFDFEEKIWNGLNLYLGSHPSIKQEEKVKIAVFGHSLGGAAANLLAARLNIMLKEGEFLADQMEVNDVYAYTFGAIDGITAQNVYKGFENIHNIYNYYDTFGPNGQGAFGLKPAGATSYGRFGNNERFHYNFDPESDYKSFTNHVSYRKAIEKRLEYSNSMQDYIKYSALCPVDIEISHDGVIKGRIIDDAVDGSVTEIPMFVYDGHKYFAVPKGKGYEVRISATDGGSMDCFMEDELNGESRIKEYKNIGLEKGKTFLSYSENSVGNCRIYLLDENGEIRCEINTDGSENVSGEGTDGMSVKERAEYARKSGKGSIAEDEVTVESFKTGNRTKYRVVMPVVSGNTVNGTLTLAKGDTVLLPCYDKKTSNLRISGGKGIIKINKKGWLSAKKATNGMEISYIADGTEFVLKVVVLEPAVSAGSISANYYITEVTPKIKKLNVKYKDSGHFCLILNMPLTATVDSTKLKQKGGVLLNDGIISINDEGKLFISGVAASEGKAIIPIESCGKKHKLKITYSHDKKGFGLCVP